MPKTIPPKLYTKPMVTNDAARLVERAERILRAEADRFARELARLNQREATLTRGEAEEHLRFQDMRIPRVVTPANAKPASGGRPRKSVQA